MFAEIIVDIKSHNTDKVYTYKIPDNMEMIKVGMRVSVPFNNRYVDGYVVKLIENTLYPDEKIKYIRKILDKYSVFNEKMIELAKWMKDYYNCYFSESLQSIMPAGIKKGEKKVKMVQIKSSVVLEDFQKKAPKQYEILNYLQRNSSMRLSELVKNLDTDYSTVRALEEKGLIKIYEIEVNRYKLKKIAESKPLLLTDEQSYAVNKIKKSIYNNIFDKYLLFGVTGSGKTEVYLQLIDMCLKSGKNSIVLVPEISLTAQTIERFVSRFGDKVAVMHSGLSQGERFDEWRKIKDGLVNVVVGVRNAVFAPFSNVGLIIIDEEHESTYKQSDMRPRYNAKEVAEKRCEIENAVLVLGSATPSIETYYKAMHGEYKMMKLSKRINLSMPQIEIVNMSNELSIGNSSIFSRSLYGKIKENLKKREQTILFLNRRGYSSFVSCRDCGYVPKCPNCDISLTYHFQEKKLVCHYCGYDQQMADICPQCSSKRIRYLGIGTERIEKDIKKYFPEARVLRMDIDTTQTKGSHEKIFYDFKNGNADILIGTQMISKGFDIPNVTLVGVILADITLNIPDFRSGEKTFQLLTQVAGRAGRGEKPGRVIIQTYEEDNYSILASHDQNYIGFYNEEIKYREIFKYPPFVHLMNIVISGDDKKEVIKNSADIYNICQNVINKTRNKSYNKILGPASAPISKINNKFRWQVIIKSEDRNILLKVAQNIESAKHPKDIKIYIDIDPNSIM